MPVTEIAGQQVETDEEGFLVSSADWTPELAEAIAKSYDLELTDEHWKVIYFCRSDAETHAGKAPGLRRITKQSGVPTKELYRLFPKGPGKLAARISGLPKPQGCL